MSRNPEAKQLHTNISEEDYNALVKYCESKGISKNTAVLHGLELLKIEIAKEYVPNLGMEIDEFMMHQDAITKKYKNALEHICSTEERVQNQYRGKMAGLEALGETNVSLKNEITTLEESIKAKNDEIAELNETIDQLKSENNELKGKLKSDEENAKNSEILANCIQLLEKELHALKTVNVAK